MQCFLFVFRIDSSNTVSTARYDICPFGSGIFEMNEVKGRYSYGAGTYAADGSRQPTVLEPQQASHQGKYVAEIAKKLKN